MQQQVSLFYHSYSTEAVQWLDALVYMRTPVCHTRLSIMNKHIHRAASAVLASVLTKYAQSDAAFEMIDRCIVVCITQPSLGGMKEMHRC
jgi:hypothetical protein